MIQKGDKKGIALETLAYWIIAIAILVLMIIGYIILTRKGGTGFEAIKNAFRFFGG
jgi:hypothetical protein